MVVIVSKLMLGILKRLLDLGTAQGSFWLERGLDCRVF